MLLRESFNLQRLKSLYRWVPFRVALVYVLIAGLWIAFSDRFLYSIIQESARLTAVQTLKGLFFVLVTGLLLYALIRRNVNSIARENFLRRERELSYKELYDSIADIFFALDKNLRYTYWNRETELFTGMREQDAVGKTVGELLPSIVGAEAAAEAERHFKEVLRTRKPLVFTNRLCVRDTEYFHETSVYPTRIGLSVFVKDITDRVRIERQLKESLDKLQVVLDGTVNVLASVAEKRDPYIAGHQQRVSNLAVLIGQEMGISADRCEGLRVAGILHDIGKISIPSEILSKPGPLSQNEFRIVKLYPTISYDILKDISFTWPVAKIALQHKERFDGSGYPSGLKGEEIIPEARILAAADFLDAFTSHRPYRPAQEPDDAVHELIRLKGTSFDPAVVDACVKLFRDGSLKLGHPSLQHSSASHPRT